MSCDPLSQALQTTLASLSLINVGLSADDLTGDTLRNGFIKVNANFNLIYQTLSTLQTTTNIITASNDIGTKRLVKYFDINQLAPAVTVVRGDILYRKSDGSGFAKAQALSSEESRPLGVVDTVDVDCFSLVMRGYLSGVNVIDNRTYYLSHSAAGQAQIHNVPERFVSIPVYESISNNEIIVNIQRGALVGFY